MSRDFRNNHFVTSFMLEPWECYHRSNKGVWIYSFETGLLHHKPTKRIFTRRRVFPRDLEVKFNRLIETPLSRYYSNLITGIDLDRSDRDIERALLLLFFTQSCRVSQALDPQRNQSLSHLLGQNEATIDSCVDLFASESKLARRTVTSSQPMFLPVLGIFAVPFQDPACHTGWTFGFAIPLTPHIAVLMVSKSVPDSSIETFPLWACSAGRAGNANSVVIPPFAAEGMRHDLIIERIKAARNLNEELCSSVEGVRKGTAQVSATMGLELTPCLQSLHGRVSSSIANDGRNRVVIKESQQT